jgi:hypothetical protein
LIAYLIPCELRHLHQNSDLHLCDRLFDEDLPDASGNDLFNTGNLKVVPAFVRPTLPQSLPDLKFQFVFDDHFVANQTDDANGEKVCKKGLRGKSTLFGVPMLEELMQSTRTKNPKTLPKGTCFKTHFLQMRLTFIWKCFSKI